MQTAEPQPPPAAVLKEDPDILVAHLKKENAELLERIASLNRHIDWYRQQLFGKKSEKSHGGGATFPEGELQQQVPLIPGAVGKKSSSSEAQKTINVPAHTRKSKKSFPDDNVGASGLRFGVDVEIKEIECPNPATDGLSPDQYEVIGSDVVDKLCERKNGFYVKRFMRPKVKMKQSGAIITAPLPPLSVVIPGSFMDVSFLAGMVVNKILFHLPLYRTHQRLTDGGIHIARSTLTNGFHAVGDLLQPVFHALLQHVILDSSVLTMDETPVKVGVDSDKHRMKQGYFWGLYGDSDEVAFLSFDTRKHETVEEILGDVFKGTLLSDDYGAYDKFAAKRDAIVHALCWSHARRNFFEARSVEPQKVDLVLKLIGGVYQKEQEIRTKELEGAAKLAYRTAYAAPKVDEIFAWMNEEIKSPHLLPKSPFTQALNYAINNERGLRQFLSNPDIPVDTNHIERANKNIAIGKKNWLFCVSELGGEYVALFHSLLYTARLHDVDPYEYLVDILPRVRKCPDDRLYELTPRGWKIEKQKKAAAA